MRLKLIRVGDGGVYLRIPKGWCRVHEIDAGTEVELIDAGRGRLEMIIPGEQK